MTDGRRNIGIDLLRIISMCMIIMIHMNGYGKASEMIDAFSFKYFLSKGIIFFTACSVNIYAMISGFVSGSKTVHSGSVRKFLKLWFQVLFYSILLMLIFKTMYPTQIGRRQMLEAVFPTTSMQYWYFTFYIPILFFAPYLNLMVSHMDIAAMRKLIALLFLIFSIIPWVFQTDWVGLDGGFNAFWLIIMYLFGAWLRKESDITDSPLAKCRKSWLLFSLIGLILIQVLLRYALDKLGAVTGAGSGIMHAFSSYTSPFIVLEACVMVIFFGSLKLAETKKIRWISELGVASFGVYLIHDNHFVREYMMMERLIGIGQLNPVAYMLAMLGCAVGIYMCCAAVELLRSSAVDGMNYLYIRIKQGEA